MQKLVLTEPAVAVAPVVLRAMDDGEVSTDSFAGRLMVVNFWATWCAPCRQEMPSLDRLQALRPDISVIAVATGPNPVPSITRFWDEAGITHLTPLRDADRAFSAAMGVLALPVTVFVNAQGQEVARLIGDAEWDAPETLAVLDALAAQ